MTNPQELCERLRRDEGAGSKHWQTCSEAADLIEAQAKQIAYLEAQTENAEARVERAVAILSRIHSYITPEDVRLPDGRIMRFDNAKIEREMLRGLCEAIRRVPDELAEIAHPPAAAASDYVLSLLIAAGHVTQEKVDEAREIARKTLGAASQKEKP